MISRSTRGGLVGAQVVAAASRSIASVRTSAQASRKLLSSCLPSPVSTDSGWNCTPSAGSSRWRIAHDHVARARGDLEARRAGRGPRPASGSGRPRTATSARGRSSAVVLDRRRLAVHRLARARPSRRTPRPAPGGPGRRRAPASPARRSGGSPRPRCPPRPACTAPARRPPAPAPRLASSSPRLGVVAHHVGLGPQLAQVLHEVVGERVVVVEDEDAHQAQSPWPHASSIASNTAPALASVSRTS